MEAHISRGWGSKAFACIEAFNQRNQCVRHIWIEAKDQEEIDNWEDQIYQMYLMYLSLIQDESLRWNFFANRYEERYEPNSGRKCYTYKIFDNLDYRAELVKAKTEPANPEPVKANVEVYEAPRPEPKFPKMKRKPKRRADWGKSYGPGKHR